MNILTGLIVVALLVAFVQLARLRNEIRIHIQVIAELLECKPTLDELVKERRNRQTQTERFLEAQKLAEEFPNLAALGLLGPNKLSRL